MDNSCHCEALPNRGPRGILCTRGEKAHTSKRVSVIACDNVISKTKCATHLPEGNPFQKTHARYFCTCVEKKAHTSKRVSVIACDNVISKVQCAPRGYYLSTSSGLKKPSRQLSMKYFTSGRSTSIAFSVVFSAIANSPFPDKVSSTHLI